MMLEHFTPLLGVAISVALYAAPWSDVAVVRASGAPKSSIVPGNLAVYLAATVTGAVYASLLGDRYYFMATAPGAMAFSFYVACAAPFSLQPEPRPRVSSVVALTSCSLCLVGALARLSASLVCQVKEFLLVFRSVQHPKNGFYFSAKEYRR